MANKTQITLTIDAELLDGARKHAKRNRRSLSNLLEVWIEEKTADTVPVDNLQSNPNTRPIASN